VRVLKPKKLIVELSEEEATVLCALVGGVSSSYVHETKTGRVIREVFDCLNTSLHNRNTTFSDYFEGEVEVKT
jgi:hypothetical protein